MFLVAPVPVCPSVSGGLRRGLSPNGSLCPSLQRSLVGTTAVQPPSRPSQSHGPLRPVQEFRMDTLAMVQTVTQQAPVSLF